MKQIFILILCISIAGRMFSQGQVGIGTTSPAEKLDINGALIIRGDAVSSPAVASTIRWNSTNGVHDGRTSSAVWQRLENTNQYLNGSYTTIICGIAGSVSVGTYSGTSTTIAETPFGTAYEDKRSQFLYFASEMTTGGLCTGNITAVGFNVVSLGSPSIINGLTIKIKSTTLTSLSGTWDASLTTVYSANPTLVVGPNTFTLSTPFNWDGTSNLIVEVCFDNVSSGSNSTVDISNSAVNTTRYTYANASSGCSLASYSFDTKRPVIEFTGNTSGPLTGSSYYVKYNKGIVIGTPVIGGSYVSHGPGSVTAQAVYDDNVLLTDYVFDKYFDGIVKKSDEAIYSDYTMKSINEMSDFTKKYRHLPTIDGRDVWHTKGYFSVGELSTQLWETYETEAIYLTQINDRLKSVETIVNTIAHPLQDAYELQIDEIKTSNSISEAEKIKQIEEIQNSTNTPQLQNSK